MKTHKFSLLFAVSAMLGACATPAPRPYFAPASDQTPLPSIQIVSVYDTVTVNATNLGAEANRCVPQLTGNSKAVTDLIQKFPNNNTTAMGHVSSSKRFVVRNMTAYCQTRSANNFPIFAAEAFLKTANPVGVPPDITDGWYKKVALTIAEKGTSKVAYKFQNGNAAVVSYWTDSTTDVINYSYDFKRVGAWESEQYDSIFASTSLSGVTTVKNNGQMVKSYPLSHR